MKKLLCALLALAMLCACAAAETVDVTGTWYLAEALFGDDSFNPADGNFVVILTFQTDGTVAVSVQEVLLNDVDEAWNALAQWSMDGDSGIVAFENYTIGFALVDGNLVFEDYGFDESPDDGSEPEADIRIFFSREKPKLAYFDLGAPRTDVTLEDFDGSWNATAVKYGPIMSPIESYEEAPTLELSGGKGTAWLQLDMTEAVPVTGEMVDGTLILTEAVPDADETSSMVLILYDSGSMTCSTGEYIYCFERVE